MSQLSRIMIRLSPVTWDKSHTRVQFKMCSVKGLTFSICFFGPLIVFNILMFTFVDMSDAMESQTPKLNIVDTLSTYFSLAFTGFVFMIPFTLFSGIPIISSMVSASDHKWPKYGLTMVAGTLVGIASVSFGKQKSNYLIFTSSDIYIFHPQHPKKNLDPSPKKSI